MVFWGYWKTKQCFVCPWTSPVLFASSSNHFKLHPYFNWTLLFKKKPSFNSRWRQSNCPSTRWRTSGASSASWRSTMRWQWTRCASSPSRRSATRSATWRRPPPSQTPGSPGEGAWQEGGDGGEVSLLNKFD